MTTRGAQRQETSSDAPYRLDRWEEAVGKLTDVEPSSTDGFIVVIGGRPVLLLDYDDTDPSEFLGEMVCIIRTTEGYTVRVVDPVEADS